MNRRQFIKIGSVSMAAMLAGRCAQSGNYDIELLTDMPAGHLLLESRQWPVAKILKTNYLIVGGGMAGMSAAVTLKNEDFLLFELSDTPGGTSTGGIYKKSPICHGAHYDLSYPSYYGREALALLESLNIVHYDSFSDSWKFVDKHYLIPKKKESKTLSRDTFRKDVLPDGEEKVRFFELMESYYGRMPMPTRLIAKELRHLNDIPFSGWLYEKLPVSHAFTGGIDYQMKDDYGAGAEAVSALAGIHYYACRPYRREPVELFSPPEGNFYFIKKMLAKLPAERICTAHLVKSVRKNRDGFQVEVMDIRNRELLKVTAKKVIYAGQKYALKYVFPEAYPLFEKNVYAPWAVVNIIIKNSWQGDAFWQNEILSDDAALLGFVDSASQFMPDEALRVFTVYYNFRPEEREMMSQIGDRKAAFSMNAVKQVERYFNKPVRNSIEKIYIKLMGHAMPVPVPGYLFNDANGTPLYPGLAWAGVDNGRLPLLFEAVDSGVMAARSVMDKRKL